MDLLLATNNEHKRTELAQIFNTHRLVTPANFGISFDYEETAETFRENALGKALALRDQCIRAGVAEAAGLPVIADDSGLCVAALDGRPGVRSARYGSPDGGRTELPSAQRNQLLLGELSDAADRSAFFVCCMVAVYEPHRFSIVQETFEGTIATGPSGSGGFGYDPIFFLPDRGKSVAELADDEKNRISHRGKAAAAMAQMLETMQP